MNKESSGVMRQTTLFQSWKRSGASQDNHAERPFSGNAVSCDDNNIIDVDDFDDNMDDILIEAMDETLQKYHGSSSKVSSSTLPVLESTALETLPGFDIASGDSWIYPTNYPVREYQFKISKEGLFKNTMVCLPTGLGKTFIAAVVMFNFYRWYPSCKIVFMAPTKPLVSQQIEACFNVMGIPQSDTAEMTGSMPPTERKLLWDQKRVFFLTPQVMMNDLTRGICPASMVKCLVVDEAHKALGNHAYCQVIKGMLNHSKQFRVLALSATPGSDIKAVQQVLNNLVIAHIEIRSEQSSDIQPYTYDRNVEKIVVKLGEELSEIKKIFLNIISQYLKRLVSMNVISDRSPDSMSKFYLLKAREAFRQDPPVNLTRNLYGAAEGDFAICMSLYHAYELLQLHGMRPFYNFLQGMIDGEKGSARSVYQLIRNEDFREMMNNLASKYKVDNLNNSLNGSLMIPGSSRSSKQFVIGHPKLIKLQEIILQYFESCKQDNLDSRTMVFSQYRDSVMEITDMLNQMKPLVKAMSFVGQKSKGGKSGRGFTQKEQIKVIKDFRNGGYNTLVSTCVGEEGLDIGEVDLIVCYDAPNSPIRLVQRMGRTGRKRKGKIIVLVTEGKEEKMYNQSLYNKKNIHKALMNGLRFKTMFVENPRMVPAGLNPRCVKLHMQVDKYCLPDKISRGIKSRTGNQSISEMLAIPGKKSNKTSPFLTDEELSYWNEHFRVESEMISLPTAVRMSCLTSDKDIEMEPTTSKAKMSRTLSYADWLPWQNVLQPTENVSHTTKTKSFVQTIQLIEFQTNMSDDDDPYGLEMTLYLNKDDVIENNNGVGYREPDRGHHVCDVVPACQMSENVIKKESEVSNDAHDMIHVDSDCDLPTYDCLQGDNVDGNLDKFDDGEFKSATCTQNDLPFYNPGENLIEEFPGIHQIQIRSPPSDNEMFDSDRESMSPVDIDEIIRSVHRLDVCEKSTIEIEKNLITDELADEIFIPFGESFDVHDSHVVDSCGQQNVINQSKSSLNEANSLSTSGDMYSMTQLLHRVEHNETQMTSPSNKCIVKMAETKSPGRLVEDVDFVVPPSPVAYAKNKRLLSISQKRNTNFFFKRKTFGNVSCQKNENSSLKSDIRSSAHSRDPRSSRISNSDLLQNLSSNIGDQLDEVDATKNVSNDSRYPDITTAKNLMESSESNSKNIRNTSLPTFDDVDDSFLMKFMDDVSAMSPNQENKSSPKEKDFFDDIDDAVLLQADSSFKILSSTSSVSRNKLKSVDVPSGEVRQKLDSNSSNRVASVSSRLTVTDVSSSFDDFRTPVCLKNKTANVSKDGNNTSPLLRRKKFKHFNVTSPESEVTSEKIMKRKHLARQFIEDEAELSDKEHIQSDDEFDSSQMNSYDQSFINDDMELTQLSPYSGQMKRKSIDDVECRTMYAKSIRSPLVRGQFKLQFNPKNDMNVYSQQQADDDDDSYEQDSFCVDNDFVEYTSDETFERPKAKDENVNRNKNGRVKRKRVIRIEDSSSDDEGDVCTAISSNQLFQSFQKSEESSPFLVPNSVKNSVSENPKEDAQPWLQANKVKPNVQTVLSREKRLKLQKIKKEEYLRNNLAKKKPAIDTENSSSNDSESCQIFTSNNRPAEIRNRDLSSKLAVVEPISLKCDDRKSSFGQNQAVRNESPKETKHETSKGNFSVLLNSSKIRDNLIISVDSREINGGSSVVSNLRMKHSCNVSVRRLNVCDYVVSNRVAVNRLSMSEFSKVSNKTDLVNWVRNVCELFDRPVIIVEKDRVKSGDMEKNFSRTKYMDSVVALLAQTHVKLLYSNSAESSAYFLATLANQEARKGMDIDVDVEIGSNQQSPLQFYQSLPRISYVCALNLVHSFSSVAEFLNCSVEDLKKNGKLSESRARELFQFVRRNFNADMLPATS